MTWERTALVAVVQLAALFQVGVVFGWAPLLVVLEDEGAYANRCNHDVHNVTSPSSPTSSSSTPTVCDAQAEALSLVYTVATIAQAACGLAVGMTLDRIGPRNTTLLGGLSMVGSCYLIGYAPFEAHLLVGVPLLAVAGMLVYLSSFHAGCAVDCPWHQPIYPRHSNAILGGVSCMFDSSTVMFLVFQLLHFNLGWSLLRLFQVYGVVVAAQHVLLFVLWTLNARKSAEEQALVGKASEDPEVAHLSHDDGLMSDSDDEEGVNAAHADDSRGIGRGASRSTSRERTLMRQRPLREQLRSFEFAYIIVYVIVHATRSNSFLGIAAPMLQHMGDKGPDYFYTTALSAIVPAGFLFVPVIERMLSRLGYALCLDVINLLGAVYGGMALVDVLPLQLGTAAVYTFYRAFLFSQLAAYHAQIFGPATMGTTIGLMWTLAAVAQPLQYAGVVMTDTWFKGNYFWLNVMLLSSLVIVVSFTCALRLKSREPCLRRPRTAYQRLPSMPAMFQRAGSARVERFSAAAATVSAAVHWRRVTERRRREGRGSHR